MACSVGFRFLLVVLITTASLTVFSLALPTVSPTNRRIGGSQGRHLPQTDSVGFWIDNDMFLKDGAPFQIIGGDVHYFRVPPQYWRDRLLRAKALGLNTIQTYVPWNIHEPQRERWVFEGIADIVSFLKLAQELGFLVMLRAGPYICAEWDLGGFPAWLLSIKPALKLRSSDPLFLAMVERWWGVLLPKVEPLLYKNGGPVVMVQIENEFGSYGDDKIYLHHLIDLARRILGNDIILYTTDGGSRDALDKGTISGDAVFSAVDFETGADPWPIFELQKQYNAPGKSPSLCTEFYTGWLTHWGERIATTNASSTAAALQRILSGNASSVLYMAHGGSNFGFLNGANTGADDFDYKADITSYDYDAPIKESGDVDNPKFRALRNVIQEHIGNKLPPIPPNNERATYGLIKLSKLASLFDNLHAICDPTEVVKTEKPLAMEAVGQMFGFLLYASKYTRKAHRSILSISKVHDRGQVFVSCLEDNLASPVYVGTITRWSNRALSIPIDKCSSNIRLFILVENMGRVNYGKYLYDQKGILSDVLLDGVALHQWKLYPIPLNNVSDILKVDPIIQVADSRIENIYEAPGFYKGHFSINHVKDTYISFQGWNKGVVFVNNFNIGRFWPAVGPQCALYVPAPVLCPGENVVVVFELHTPKPDLTITLVENPDFTCGSDIQQI